MRRLLLAALLLTACASSAPRTTAAPVAAPSAAPAACANLPPVYHPARLQLIAACTTFKGRVIADLHEQDGDRHLWIAPDAAYDGLLNGADRYRGQRAMVAEIVPICATQPAGEAAAAHCPASTLPEPKPGDLVVLTGPLVEDRKHANWREIHPVATLVVVG